MSPQDVLLFLSTFTAAFLSGFFTAVPFLMLGGVASGLVAVFLGDDEIAHLPGPKALIPISGALLGFVFPVGQVGAIPLARRLIKKGMPLSAGVAFVIAGPVVSLVTMASTFAAYGPGPILFGRLVIALMLGVGTGFLFLRTDEVHEVIRPSLPGSDHTRRDDEDWRQALRRATRIGGDEVFDIGRYVVVGALLVGLLEALGTADRIAGLNGGPVGGVLMMALLAIVQSPEPAVDALLSLLYAPAVTTGAILTYLAPILDVQAMIVMGALFRPKIVAYLFAVTTLAALLIGLFVTLNLPW